MKPKRFVYVLHDCEMTFGVFTSKKKAHEYIIQKKFLRKSGEMDQFLVFNIVYYPEGAFAKRFLKLTKEEVK